ncbi:MAG: carboxymuconolactone decarboxylase family protein [Acidimicrobiales bacterium]
MSWLLDGATSRKELMGMHPDLARDHERILDELWNSSVDPRILEFCRLRTATLLGNRHAWTEPRSAAAVAAGLDEAMVQNLSLWVTDQRFDAATKTCLKLAEQYVLDVHGISDEQVAEVAAVIGNDGVVTLTTALATWEISHRFDNALLPQTDDQTGDN